jgi:hypothetical protein
VIKALRRRLTFDPAGRELGVTLVEVVVAFVILMILSSAVLGILLTSLKTTNNDKLRVAASSLAAREVDIVRQYFASGPTAVRDVVDPAHATVTNPDPLRNGINGQPLVVNGVPFTVVRTVQVQLAGAGKSPCDGGDQVAHPSYSVTATVTWPNMGTTRPIVNQTILTPPKGVLKDDTTGYLAVKVTNATASPTNGVVVTVHGPAGTFTPTTDVTGCAVTPLSQPGSYTASLNTTVPPYVDFYGNPTPALTGIDVQSGQLTVKTLTYDQAATINVSFATAAGYGLPQSLPSITLANSGLQPTGTKNLPSTGATTSLSGLWPFPSGYTMWAGCAGADPAAAGGSRVGPIVAAHGQTASATIPFTPVDVWVDDSQGQPVANASVTAASAACSSTPDSPLTLGTTDTNGHLATSLPYGTWTISASGTAVEPISVGDDPISTEVDLP